MAVTLKSLKGSKSKDQLNHKHRNYASMGFRTVFPGEVSTGSVSSSFYIIQN